MLRVSSAHRQSRWLCDVKVEVKRNRDCPNWGYHMRADVASRVSASNGRFSATSGSSELRTGSPQPVFQFCSSEQTVPVRLYPRLPVGYIVGMQTARVPLPPPKSGDSGWRHGNCSC